MGEVVLFSFSLTVLSPGFKVLLKRCTSLEEIIVGSCTFFDEKMEERTRMNGESSKESNIKEEEKGKEEKVVSSATSFSLGCHGIY